jgi:hypothetical protein
MSIYDLTYSKLGKQLLPVDKRNPLLTAFVTNLLVPMQWLRDLWFGTYRTGAIGAYDTGTTYAKYAQVVYNKVLYSSLQAGNTSNTPSANSTWWTPIQNNFIGLSERIMYNGQTLVLTWALNKWFGTNFLQPNEIAITTVARSSNVATITAPGHGLATGNYVFITALSNSSFNGVSQITVVDANNFTYASTGSNLSSTGDSGTATKLSDIYILGNIVPPEVFISGSIGNSSVVYSTYSPQYIIDSYLLTGVSNFTIYVPVAVYNALASTDANRQSILGAFVNQYIPAGMIYNIQTY